jgi:hypothetical protein
MTSTLSTQTYELAVWTGIVWERVTLIHAASELAAMTCGFSNLVASNRPIRLTRLDGSGESCATAAKPPEVTW